MRTKDSQGKAKVQNEETMASFNFFLHISALIWLGICSCSHGQSYHNMSSDTTLAPVGPQTSWLSPSGDFALGFRPLQTDSSRFLLAVWFNKIPSRTIVWCANGDAPVDSEATLALTSDGQLLLKNQSSTLWNANGVSGISYAAMLDTGNFILVDANGSPLWQSFDNPTDTILPSQVMGLKTTLWSRLTDTDFSDGRFVLRMQDDGNLVFYVVAVPTGYRYDPFWASSTVNEGTQLLFNKSGSIDLFLKNGTETFTAATIDSVGGFYQRATLHPDGVFRQYVHPKNNSNTSSEDWEFDWNMVDYQPKGICGHDFMSGSGICGFNSYCESDSNSSVVCECLTQYSFFDLSSKYKGCKADFASQSCEADEAEAAQLFEFKTLNNVNFSGSDYDTYSPVDEEQCRKECLSDCFCSVATYEASSRTCWKKKLPLSNGRHMDGIKTLVKVPKGNVTSHPPTDASEKGTKRTWLMAASILLGSSSLLLLTTVFFVTCFFYVYSTRMKNRRQVSTSLPVMGLQSYTYRELEEATDGFKEELGRGASSVVYKGFLKDEARTIVAVKKLDKLPQETEKEFMNELKSIGMTYHKNLVQMIGFCCQGTHRLLVYQFMSNGSLMRFLLGGVRPSWEQRARVAIGIASGLLYLHEECICQIIHCDIKPQNVLLDDHFVPRISDFGLAKLLSKDQFLTRTAIRGTKGYVAPEWFKKAGVTAKVDVYSFGVVLLEIVCCRRNVQVEEGVEDEAVILMDWVGSKFRQGRLDLLLEGDEEAAADMRRVERFVKVALWCVQEEPSMRPTMQKVSQMLAGTVEVPVPPEPSSYLSSLP